MVVTRRLHRRAQSSTLPLLHPQWDGLKGHVCTAHLEAVSASSADKIYVCGPHGFVAAALEALEAANVDDSHIHVFN